MSRFMAEEGLMGTVFDVEEAAEAELRILFTLADIDELYVASRSGSLII